MRTHRLLVAALLFPAFIAAPRAGQSPQPLTVTAADLTPAQMERFLLTGRVISKRRPARGVTDSYRATLTDGRIVHDAQVQAVDIYRAVFNGGRASEVNFRDTYRYNVGGYRLARLLGMTNVPMSVKRRIDGKDAAVTWWIDDVMFDDSGRLAQTAKFGPDPERTAKQDYVRLVFDELIQNRDRNQGNLIWTKDWTLWLIDHTRAFRLGHELLRPERLVRCERRLYEAMRGLTLETMTAAMGDVMTRAEMTAVLARRDRLVKHFEERIALVGELSVLFTM
jgi:hypothetical protein